MPLGGAAVGAFIAFVLESCVINRDVLATAHLQAAGIATEVDRITATALGLAADRAVAALIRVGVGAGQTERHRAAMAGTFELHGNLRQGLEPTQDSLDLQRPSTGTRIASPVATSFS